MLDVQCWMIKGQVNEPEGWRFYTPAKSKNKSLPSVVLNLLTLKLQSLEIRQRHKTCVKQLLCCLHSEFSRRNLTGTNFAVSSVRRESTEENAAVSESDQTSLSPNTGTVYPLKCYNYRANTINNTQHLFLTPLTHFSVPEQLLKYCS